MCRLLSMSLSRYSSTSVKAGFGDWKHMDSDPDLAPLRGEPRYHSILEDLKKSGAPEKKASPPIEKGPKKRSSKEPGSGEE